MSEPDGLLDADAFGHDADDGWYRQSAEDEPRQLTCVDKNTFCAEFRLPQRPCPRQRAPEMVRQC